MKKELISVIVPVYKVEKYLDRCVASIVNQTYHNLEIILVDDGSPDRCGEMCDVWAKKDDRIRVIHKINGGVAAARNVGIEQAKGTFLGFVDSDDYIASDMYEYLYAHRVKGGVCSCGFIEIDERNRKKRKPDIFHILPKEKYNFQEAAKFYVEDEVKQDFCKKSLQLGSYVWTKLYDRNVFENIRFPTGETYEDISITLELMHKVSVFSMLPECKYYYVQRDNSIVHISGSVNLEHLRARQRQLEQVKNFQLPNELIDVAGMLVIKAYYNVYRDILRLPEERAEKYHKILEKCKEAVHSDAFSKTPFSFKRRFWWKIWGAPLYKAFWNLKRK